MHISFDPAKDAANIAKHGISLTFAAQVLTDPYVVEIVDLRFDYGEDRYIAYALADARVWVCVYTPRGTERRVISLRKANDRETTRYHAAAGGV